MLSASLNKTFPSYLPGSVDGHIIFYGESGVYISHSHSSSSHGFSQPLTVINPVQLLVFSGDGNDVEFDLWRYSISYLQKDGTLTSQGLVRRSLRGRAARVARTVGPVGSTSNLLVKLDSIFGTVDTKEKVLARFYGAKQGEN